MMLRDALMDAEFWEGLRKFNRMGRACVRTRAVFCKATAAAWFTRTEVDVAAGAAAACAERGAMAAGVSAN
jgi:hypothetical protein